MKARIDWIDSLRFFAIIYVVITHFIVAFSPNTLRYWTDGYTGIILYGITGKLCVAFFCVLLGFFASLKFAKKSNSYGSYVLTRYKKFSINLLAINLIVIISMIIFKIFNVIPNDLAIENIYLTSNIPSFRTLLSDSFFFSSNIVATFWCIKDFFIGSLIVGLISWYKPNNNSNKLIYYIIAFIIALFAGSIWVSICILGGVLHCILEYNLRILKNKILLFLLFIVICFLIRNPENEITFIKDGIASCLFLIICFNFNIAQKILNNKVLSYWGKISFNIYLLHTPVHLIFTYFFIGKLKYYLSWELTILISLIVTIILDIILAHFMHKILDINILKKILILIKKQKHYNN